ncbi:MAG: nucleotide exchange factor GrpE [Actinobacteria bacterium]|nr:nucleotide exchange factor GrpE [Actinomycetota bacterium]MCL6104022.1 nucleotide exchange factor GrpE [Actinomycetota bacterium]
MTDANLDPEIDVKATQRERTRSTRVDQSVKANQTGKKGSISNSTASQISEEALGAQPQNGQDNSSDEVVQDIETLRAQRDEYLNAYQRVQADFENYKKRMLVQQSEYLERAAETLVMKLLPVLDSLHLGLSHSLDLDSPQDKALVQIATMLDDVLSKEGLEKIVPVGKPFDPNAHEAVMHIPLEDEVSSVLNARPPLLDTEDIQDGKTVPEDSQVVPAVSHKQEPYVEEVLRPGYQWKGKVIRPAMVKVRG